MIHLYDILEKATLLSKSRAVGAVWQVVYIASTCWRLFG